MISYAPIDETIRRLPPKPPVVVDNIKPKPVDNEIESECYYVTVVFITAVIVILMSDMIKK